MLLQLRNSRMMTAILNNHVIYEEDSILCSVIDRTLHHMFMYEYLSFYFFLGL